MSADSKEPLASVQAKFVRAHEVAQQLQDRSLNWAGRVPAELFSSPTIQTDRAAGGYRVRMELPEVPLEISVLFGEVLHDLRSALDHLAGVLVKVSGCKPKEGPQGTHFPIALRRPENGVRIKPFGHWPEAEALVNSVQPFSDPQARGELHPLWMLHQLNLKDKHRLLNTAALAGGGNVAFRDRKDRDQPISQESRRSTIQLIDAQEQFIPEEGELFDDVIVSGLWTYRITLSDGPGARGKGLDGLCFGLIETLWNEVVLPFDQLVDKRLGRTSNEDAS